MDGVAFGRLSSEEQRLTQIGERAHFLSKHREAEGRPADPVCDWLNAEWIQEHAAAYREVEKTLIRYLEAVIAGRVTMNTRLPSGLLLRFIFAATAGRGVAMSGLSKAVEQSVTLAGVLGLLVEGWREAEKAEKAESPRFMSAAEEYDYHLQRRAYFLSKHREAENRLPDPVCDWLDSEWTARNWVSYQAMKQALIDAVGQIARQLVTLATPIPKGEGNLQNIADLVHYQLSIPQPELVSVLRQSKTLFGSLDLLVTQRRQQGGRKAQAA